MELEHCGASGINDDSDPYSGGAQVLCLKKRAAWATLPGLMEIITDPGNMAKALLENRLVRRDVETKPEGERSQLRTR